MTRILVDHGSYELLNLGDAAMLEACVARIGELVPEACIMVITVNPQRLAEILPSAVPVLLPNPPSMLPARIRARLRVRWKRLSKTLSIAYARVSTGAKHSSSGVLSSIAPLRDAIAEADLVVAAGGGYLNDVFVAHARGVLRLLLEAHRRGKPVAMFGQGIGPMGGKRTRRLAERILPHLDVLTLREGLNAPRVARELGALDCAVTVTGDEALLLAGTGSTALRGECLGLNLRTTSYSGVSEDNSQPIRIAIAKFLTACNQPPVTFIPIIDTKDASDLVAAQDLLPDGYSNIEGGTLSGTAELVERIARCRAVVTGSYHVAVFALGQGVPVVAISNSKYYTWKFGGLRALYDFQSVRIIDMGDLPDAYPNILEALQQSWSMGVQQRQAICQTSTDLLATQKQAYERFFRDRTDGQG